MTLEANPEVIEDAPLAQTYYSVIARSIGGERSSMSFEKALNKFIDTNTQVVGAHIGRPAATDRPVIDNSYTYSLVVTFPDLETHDAYQTDPTHVAFIEEAKSLWDKVLIYDSSAI